MYIRKFYKKGYSLLEIIISLIIISLLILVTINYRTFFSLKEIQKKKIDNFMKNAVILITQKAEERETYDLCPVSKTCSLQEVINITYPGVITDCSYAPYKIVCTLKTLSNIEKEALKNINYLNIYGNTIEFDFLSDISKNMPFYRDYYADKFLEEMYLRKVMLYNLVKNYYIKYNTLPRTNIFIEKDTLFNPYIYYVTRSYVIFKSPSFNISHKFLINSLK